MLDRFFAVEEQVFFSFFYYFTLNIIFSPQLLLLILIAALQLQPTVGLKDEDETTTKVMVPMENHVV